MDQLTALVQQMMWYTLEEIAVPRLCMVTPMMMEHVPNALV